MRLAKARLMGHDRLQILVDEILRPSMKTVDVAVRGIRAKQFVILH